MTETNENTSEVTTTPRYRAAARTAVVAGVFCLVVSALLLRNEYRARRFDPVNSQELPALKARLSGTSDKEHKGRIRQEIAALDLELRRRHSSSVDFLHRGRYLLAVGIGVFLISLSYAASCRKKLPMPGPPGEEEGDGKGAARWSVAALAAVLGCAWVVFVVASAWEGGTPRGPEAYTVIDVRLGRRHAEEVDAVKPQPGETPKEVSPLPSADEIKKNWPRFRGPGGSGISAYANVPTSWNGETREGIIWKSKIPLPGENSAVVWGRRVFVTGADADKREVYCFDADSGDLLWQREVQSNAETPDVMEETGYAAPTAATDGRRVYVIFASGDIACFDLSGKEVWTRSLGAPENAYGHSSSLVLYKNLLLVLFDQGYSVDDGKSALHALDSATGDTVWDVERPVPGSWATPIVIDTPNGAQIITCGSPWVIAYDPDTGAELWRADCLGGDVAPSPVIAKGLIFVCQEYANLAAIRSDGEGDVTETHVLWKKQDGLPDTCSPLCNGELLFLVNNSGTVTCYDIAGQKVWEKEFEAEFNSSPSLVGDKVYLMTTQGVMYIFDAAREYREVGRAQLGEKSNACPAFLDGRIYIRAKEHLYCIGTK